MGQQSTFSKDGSVRIFLDMRTYTRYLIGAIIIAFIAAAAFHFWRGRSAPAAPGASAQAPQAIATSTYATTTYSVVYPVDFSVNASYAYEGVPNKPIAGVQFTVPTAIATGTNLSLDSGVSIEQLPRAKNCTADIFFLDNVIATTSYDNGVEYSVASLSDAGAGNLYEDTVYALTQTHPCTAVRYHVHSMQIGNYTPGTVTAFDQTSLIAAFDTIRRSLTITQPAL